MSYSILRIEKIKGNFITGIQIHNQREKESLSNQDINISKSHLNYDLHNNEKVNYNEKFKEIIGKYGIDKVRKNCVKSVDILMTSDNDFFKKLSEEDTKRYFEESYRFICEKYGKENIIASIVHLDEKTPHMHLTLVPITKDGRLSSRDLFTPKTLRQLQTEYHHHLTSKGFEVERGVTSDRKHIKTEKLKEQTRLQTLENQISMLENKKASLEDELQITQKVLYKFNDDLSSIKDEIKTNEKKLKDIKNEIITLNQGDIINQYNLKKTILSNDYYKISLNDLKDIQTKFNVYKEQITEYKKDNELKDIEIKSLKEQVDNYKIILKEKEIILDQKDFELKDLKKEFDIFKENTNEFILNHGLIKQFEMFPIQKEAKKIEKELKEFEKIYKEFDYLKKESKHFENWSSRWDDYHYYENKLKEKIEDLHVYLNNFKNKNYSNEVIKDFNLNKYINNYEKITKYFERSFNFECSRGGFGD